MNEGKGMLAKRLDDRSTDALRASAVQSHAHVIVVGVDWTIRFVSDNCSALFGSTAADMPGRSLADILPEEAVNLLRAQAQTLSTAEPVGHILRCPLGKDDTTADVTATRMGADLCFEFETAVNAPDHAPDAQQILRLVRRATNKTDLRDLAKDVARMAAAMAGCDRVSVHRIGKTGLDAALGLAAHGGLARPPGIALLQAVAEDFHPHPHLVADAAAARATSELHSAGADLRIDTRAMSSACPARNLTEALRAGGVGAALTIPLRVAGELWGVLLCHHAVAWTPSVGDRRALALFAQLVGYEIERLEHRLGTVARGRLAGLRNPLADAMDDTADLAAALRAYESDIAAMLSHDGWTLWHEGKFETAGLAVTRQEFGELLPVLRQASGSDAQPIDRLSDVTTAPQSLDPWRTAVMVLPLSLVTQDCLVLFRRLTGEDDDVRSWEPWEVEAGQALRAALIEARQKMIETTREARQRVQERQGLLIAELNHRIRNTLNQILGFVGQRPRALRSVDEFARTLEQRIVALARAHDDLTEHDWGRVGLRVLLDRELGPYAGGRGPTVRISGDRIDLSPTAFSTMALVLHELVTNARRHGALSTQAGRVEVDMTLAEDGFAHLVWTETGGPSVRSPEHAGYGLKLIENSVPYELRGSAELEFAPGGLIARFALPPGHFTRIRPEEELDARQSDDTGPGSDDISIDGAALILDDSLIIAIGSEAQLRAAGASHVHSCSTVDAALQVLDTGEVTFALLDVNLGTETSLAVAEQVWSDGIPAVIATGYGANEQLLSEFPPLPVLNKPFTVAEIKDVLRHFRDRNGG